MTTFYLQATNKKKVTEEVYISSVATRTIES